MKTTLLQVLIASALGWSAMTAVAQNEEMTHQKSGADKAQRAKEKQSQGGSADPSGNSESQNTGGRAAGAAPSTDTQGERTSPGEGPKKKESTNMQTGPNAARDTEKRTETDPEAGRASADAPSGTRPTPEGPEPTPGTGASSPSSRDNASRSQDGKTPSGGKGGTPNGAPGSK